MVDTFLVLVGKLLAATFMYAFHDHGVLHGNESPFLDIQLDEYMSSSLSHKAVKIFCQLDRTWWNANLNMHSPIQTAHSRAAPIDEPNHARNTSSAAASLPHHIVYQARLWFVRHCQARTSKITEDATI